METVLKAIADWIKGILTAGIMSNLSGLFDDVNTQVGNIAQQVGTKPSAFEPRVFAMIEALSRNVVLPIAGIILTFIGEIENEQLLTALETLKVEDLEIITMYAYEGYDITEISKVYGVSRPTISIKIKRITKFLKNFNFNATN